MLGQARRGRGATQNNAVSAVLAPANRFLWYKKPPAGSRTQWAVYR